MVLAPQGRPVPQLPPIEDRPAPAPILPPQLSVPGVTIFIVVANCLVAGLMARAGADPMSPRVDDLVDWGANYGPATLRGEWWRLVTSAFVHGGLLHLGFNMYVLWDLGRVVERIFGSLGYALVYLVAGIGGSFASVVRDPHVASVGASGAVFGVAGAFLAFLLRNRGRMDPSIRARLGRSLLGFVVMNLVIGTMIPGIDQAAHVGGLLVGFGAGFVVAPVVSRTGPVRPFARYPLIVLLGAAMCGATALGLVLRLRTG